MIDTDELTTWFRTTLDTVEAAVIAYRDGHPGPCLNYEGQHPDAYDEYDSCYLHIRDADASPYQDAAFGLADIAAKRRILDEHRPRQDGYTWTGPVTDPLSRRVPVIACSTCWVDHDPEGKDYDCQHGLVEFPCPTLRLLAESLAAYPGYRDEWRTQ